jgi:hypothetical protein
MRFDPGTSANQISNYSYAYQRAKCLLYCLTVGLYYLKGPRSVFRTEKRQTKRTYTDFVWIFGTQFETAQSFIAKVVA